MHIPEHLRDLAALARARKWELTHTGSGHIRWKPPKGQGPIVITGSTSHRKGFGPRTERRDLERAGLRPKGGRRSGR